MSVQIGSAFIGVTADTSAAESSLGGFVRRAGSILGPLAAFLSVRAVGRFAGEVRDAGEALATDSARIQVIAESMGFAEEGSDGLTRALVDQAKALEGLTGVQDDQIRQAQATLLTFQEVGASAGDLDGVFARATAATIDLAAAGFGSVEGNATSLGIALQDPIAGLGRLTRVGVTFNDEQKETIKNLVETGDVLGAQSLLLGAIETQVGGVAEATANTSERQARAWENVREAIGERLLPLFDAWGELVINKIAPAVEGFALKAIDLFTKVGEVFSGLFSGDGFSGEFFSGILEGIQEAVLGAVDWLAGGGLDTIIDRFLAFRTRLFDAALRLFSSLVDAVIRIAPQLIQTITTQLIPQLVQTIVTTVPILLGAAVDLFMSLVEALTEIIPIILDGVVSLVVSIADMLPTLIPMIVDAAIALFMALIDAVLTILPILIDTILVDVVPAIITALIGAVPSLVIGAITLFLALVTGLLDALPQIITALTEEAIPAIINALIDAIPLLMEAGIEIFLALIPALIEAIPQILVAVGNLGTALFDAIIGIGPKMFDAGKRLIGQVVEGITGSIGSVVSSVGNVLGNIRNLLPFSPAKEGPLAGSGDLMRAGEKMMERINTGIASKAGLLAASVETPLRNAMRLVDLYSAQIDSRLTRTMDAARMQSIALGQAAQQAAQSAQTIRQVNVNYYTQPTPTTDTVRTTQAIGAVLV